MDNAVAASAKQQQRHALVVCDMQSDFIKSIVPESHRAALIDAVQIAVCAARQANWHIIFTQLTFKSGYEGVSPQHKLYGAFQRFNQKLGDSQAHWFMEGYEGTNILPSLLSDAASSDDDEDSSDDYNIIRRQEHLPPPQLVEVLQSNNISHVTVVGCKAAYSVQAVCQVLCDKGMVVSVVRECIGDDDPIRLDAILQHLLPIYTNVINLVDYLDEAVGIETYVDVPKTRIEQDDLPDALVKYCCDCARGDGHAALYMFYLLQRDEWQPFPRQQWYIDFIDTYFCPLGKRILQFCDEPQFSQICMFIKGREWLDEKNKLVELAGDAMPTTFFIQRQQWVGETLPVLNDISDDNLCWFVKGSDKNGGRAIQICNTVQECMNLVEPDECYVVQQHIANPLLTSDDGRKFHIKFYSLLQCDEHGEWQLLTYKNAFLSTSPNKWSPNDVSRETQVTIARTKRLEIEKTVKESEQHDDDDDEKSIEWSQVYPKCKQLVATIVGRAIQQDKLQARPNKKQFEVFSADFMLDTSGKLWIIEFNFSPVLYDPSFAANNDEDNRLTTPGLKRYHQLYQTQGDAAQVNDGDMIRDAVSIAFYDSKDLSESTLWDTHNVDTFCSCINTGDEDAC